MVNMKYFSERSEPAPEGAGLAGGAEAARERPLCYIVDDEAGVCTFITECLRQLDLDSRAFLTEEDFLRAFAEETPDLIILDVSLEGGDAVDIVRLLAERKFAGAVQLISGRSPEILEDVRRIGARRSLKMLPVLHKPFRAEEIRRVVTSRSLKARSGADVNVDLGEALQREWLEFWYQPKVSLHHGRIIGAEALARLRHPEHGLLLPANFLPEAGAGDLETLGETALRQALRDGDTLARAGHDVEIAVNMPVEALVTLPIASIVGETCRNMQTKPPLVIEVTEDQVVEDTELAFEIATQLKIYDISLSIDDFGRGFSSMARLKEIPFKELKLDRDFVLNCSTDDANRALCHTIIELAHQFDSVAVAEGIDNHADLETITELGCELGQGFWFAEAMPLERFAGLMREEQGSLVRKNTPLFAANDYAGGGSGEMAQDGQEEASRVNLII